MPWLWLGKAYRVENNGGDKHINEKKMVEYGSVNNASADSHHQWSCCAIDLPLLADAILAMMTVLMLAEIQERTYPVRGDVTVARLQQRSECTCSLRKQ